MDKNFKEFLDYGASAYCARHHLQSCHMCNRICCNDNTNPIIVAYRNTINVLNEIVETVPLSNEFPALLDPINKALNNYKKLYKRTDI